MDANNALVWLTGSLYGHTIENFYSVIPWFVITLPLVLCLSYQLDILNLGEHIATALGARVQRPQNASYLFCRLCAGGAFQ